MKTKRTVTLVTIGALIAVSAFGILYGARQVQAKDSLPATLMFTAGADSENVPAGIYTTTITAADIPSDFPPEVIPILVGQWQVALTEDGAEVVSKGDDIVVIGTHRSGPSRLVLHDLEGPLACTDAHGIATGVYAWSFQNDELVLSPVNDRCFGRQFVLTAHPLQKQ